MNIQTVVEKTKTTTETERECREQEESEKNRLITNVG